MDRSALGAGCLYLGLGFVRAWGLLGTAAGSPKVKLSPCTAREGTSGLPQQGAGLPNQHCRNACHEVGPGSMTEVAGVTRCKDNVAMPGCTRSPAAAWTSGWEAHSSHAAWSGWKT